MPGGFAALFVASYAGLLLTALLFLRTTERDLDYFDVAAPSRRDLTFVIGGTVAIFAVVHVPAYYHPDPAVVASSIGVIFGGSLVFGWVYARTDNLVVPALVHGAFNAIQILLLDALVSTDPTLGAA